MSHRQFAPLDYLIFGACLFISIGIGVYHAFKGRHNKSTNDYYFGGKTMGAIPVTLSLIVTYQSSVFLLGMPAELYVYGTMFMWIFVGVIIGFVLISLLIAPLLHPLDIKTVYQYLELRYNHPAPRKLASFLGLVVVGLVSLKEVNFLRVAQKNGRIDFTEISFDPTVRHTVWGLVIGNAFHFFSLGHSQLIVQRILSCKSTSIAKRAVGATIPGFLVFWTATCTLGLMVFSYFYERGCDPLKSKIIKSPNQILPYFVMNIFEDVPGLPGLFLATLFSATISTLSSGLNSLPIITWEDFLKPMIPTVSDGKATLIGKFLVILYGGLAIGIAYIILNTGILQVTQATFGCINGPVVGMFILGATFRCANYKGALVGWLVSFSVVLWITFGAVFEKKRSPFLQFGPVYNCGNTTGLLQTTTVMNVTSSTLVPLQIPDLLWIYKISYVWYTPISVVICVSIGTIVSIITGGRRQKIDPKYLYTCLRREVSEDSNSSKLMKMTEMNTQIDSEEFSDS